jgi:basic membrane lipoprotein Med (substrate-binding protein (PBP1-ABC) superfamily)/DNA-binding SARP family transcriptional activator
MYFRILGSLEATADGTIAELGSPKQRALLAMLLLHSGEVVSVDRLIDALWAKDPPRTAAHSIQIYVSELRKALTPLALRDVIITRTPGYQLRVDADDIDARKFERLVDNGVRQLRSGDRAGGTVALREALELWSGPVLSDFAYDEFALPHIRRLNDRHLDAIEELADAELADGRVAEALSLAEAAMRDDPLRERAREIAMLSLYRSGRHAEALRTYQRLRQHLVEELGLDPSPSVQRLQERILLHDPTLLPVAQEAAVADAMAANPYKGLRPFAEEDALDFFGRDALVGQLVDALRNGQRLVALVGPSGSGKSSAVAAGLLPRLRKGTYIEGSDRWDIRRLAPGRARVLELELVAACAAAPKGEGASHTLVVIDPFEDLFVDTDEVARRRVLRTLSTIAADRNGHVAVVLTLRADYYDRPLLDPDFAAVFIPAVINALPMTTEELESAIVGPTARMGIVVEPKLIAELVVDAAAQPGALPLLQHALTELFDRHGGSMLTLADYRALGGLRGLLSRRADSLYQELDDDEQRVALQVFLRLVRAGSGAIDSRCRFPLSELNGLDIDPVALSSVLDTFGQHRLLSFDRDDLTGNATVEIAHDALLREWDRLAGWIERHRAMLRRLEALRAAADDWEASGRSSDYLLVGSRLDEFDATAVDGVLQFTGRERAFLTASIERRDGERSAEIERVAMQRRLEHRARSRLVALVVSVVALAGIVAYVMLRPVPGEPNRAALLYNDGGAAITKMVQSGFDSAVAERHLVSNKVGVCDCLSADDSLRDLSKRSNLIVVASVDTHVDVVALEYPSIRYVVLDQPAFSPNVTRLVFAVNQATFLAGVTAALTSKSGIIGFVGGVDNQVLWPFEAGFEAGARAVNPQIQILSEYLSPEGDYAGFNDKSLAVTAATKQYTNGADVIFVAAGDAGLGVFSAATAVSTATNIHRWAIGVDSDQFNTVSDNPANVDAPAWRPHILTSVVKRMDVGVHDALVQFSKSPELPPAMFFDLKNQGVDLAYSGGFIDPLRATIDTFRRSIDSGERAIPCLPEKWSSKPRSQTYAPDYCTT